MSRLPIEIAWTSSDKRPLALLEKKAQAVVVPLVDDLGVEEEGWRRRGGGGVEEGWRKGETGVGRVRGEGGGVVRGGEG